MVVTNDAELSEKAKLLREYGWVERYVSHVSGWNTRLDELQAAMLNVKLKHLDEDNSKRARLAEIYNKELSAVNISVPCRRENCTHVYHLYVIRSTRRAELLNFLREKGIDASIHYPVPVHLQPAYIRLGNRSLRETETLASQVLTLPMYPELSEAEVHSVIEAVREFVS